MGATLAGKGARCKHTFGTSLDFERAFDKHDHMHRTYVRRRLVATLAGIAVVAVVSGQVATAAQASDQPVLVTSRSYVIRPGDTLWSIAISIAPERDPREVVAELQRSNGGDSTRLSPGETLSIPTLG